MTQEAVREIITSQVYSTVVGWVASNVAKGDKRFLTKDDLKLYCNCITYMHYFIELGEGVESFILHYKKFADRDEAYLEERIAWHQHNRSMKKRTAQWIRDNFHKKWLLPLSNMELAGLQADSFRY